VPMLAPTLKKQPFTKVSPNGLSLENTKMIHAFTTDTNASIYNIAIR